MVCVTHFDHYHFDRVGPANYGGASAFPPALVDLSSRLERAAAARIGGPTIGQKMTRQTD
jgi:hypothetical protein